MRAPEINNQQKSTNLFVTERGVSYRHMDYSDINLGEAYKTETLRFGSNMAACIWALKYGDNPDVVSYEVIGRRVIITTKTFKQHEL